MNVVYKKIFNVPPDGPSDSISSVMYKDDSMTFNEKWI